MADEKSLSQTSIGNSSPSYVDTVSGFHTPFQDAIIKKLPDSGQPTGSILPKP